MKLIWKCRPQQGGYFTSGSMFIDAHYVSQCRDRIVISNIWQNGIFMGFRQQYNLG